MQCQAKAKSTQVQCRRRAVKGKRVCTVHGGLTPSGKAHGAYKHGRYSKHLPSKRAERFEEAKQDKKLFDLQEDVALLDVRLVGLFEKLDTGESSSAWEDAEKGVEAFRKALASGDAAKRQSAFQDIEDAVQRGQDLSRTWNDIHLALEQRRRFVESQRNYLLKSQYVVSVETVNVLVAAMLESIARNVDENSYIDMPKTINDINRLIPTDD